MTPRYDRDGITLYCGDARLIDEWQTAAVLVFDPPYGIDYGKPTTRTKGGGSGIVTPGKDRSIRGDKDTAVRDAILSAWGDRPALVFGSWRVDRPAKVRQRIVWIKANTNPALGGTPWSNADEEVYVLGCGWQGTRCLNYFVSYEPRSGNYGWAATVGHPNAKPTDLMMWLLERCPAGVVADPCAGSGATLLAAKMMGRKAIGVEEDPKYCDLIVQRLESSAGRTGLFADERAIPQEVQP